MYGRLVPNGKSLLIHTSSSDQQSVPATFFLETSPIFESLDHSNTTVTQVGLSTFRSHGSWNTNGLSGERCPSFHGINLQLVGGFNPSEKYESQLGLFFPMYGKIKFMVQTTNQIVYYSHCHPGVEGGKCSNMSSLK